MPRMPSKARRSVLAELRHGALHRRGLVIPPAIKVGQAILATLVRSLVRSLGRGR